MDGKKNDLVRTVNIPHNSALPKRPCWETQPAWRAERTILQKGTAQATHTGVAWKTASATPQELLAISRSNT